MKRVNYLLVAMAALVVAASCNSVSYKKTKSGLLYKIISSNSKDSVAKPGDWLKIHYIQKLNDSVLQNSYDKMPIYQKVTADEQVYNPAELYTMLRKGDSVVAVMMIDSIYRKGLAQPGQLPEFMKNGDRLTLTLRVVDVIRSDSAYQTDMRKEYEKDMPRQRKEQEEQVQKMHKEREDAQAKEEAELEKTGEIGRQLNELQSFFTAKKITGTEKAGKGTFVVISQQGTGPQAENGKYVTVNYVGRHLDTDSIFDQGSFTRKLGVSALIIGIEDGIRAFKEGGKGQIYIAGFRAYGSNPQQGSPFRANEPLKFDVTITKVSDTDPEAPQAPQGN